jgi:hypothetical protein
MMYNYTRGGVPMIIYICFGCSFLMMLYYLNEYIYTKIQNKFVKECLNYSFDAGKELDLSFYNKYIEVYGWIKILLPFVIISYTFLSLLFLIM